MSSDTAAGVLDSIDGAFRDFETSNDAMRWLPEEKRATAPPPGAPPGRWILLADVTWIAPVVAAALAGDAAL